MAIKYLEEQLEPEDDKLLFHFMCASICIYLIMIIFGNLNKKGYLNGGIDLIHARVNYNILIGIGIVNAILIPLILISILLYRIKKREKAQIEILI